MGDRLESTAEAAPGSFVHVPPLVPHQELNTSGDESLACVLARTGLEPVVANLALGEVAHPQEIRWVDGLHSCPSEG